MKSFITILCLLVVVTTGAQTASQEVPNEDKLTLPERYQLMKSRAQTYNDYKVVREYVLDGVWKITLDSVQAQKRLLKDARTTIAALEADRKSALVSLQQKETSMEEIVYDSTHISVFGMGIDKRFFLTTVILIILGLLLALGVMTGRLKLMYGAIREKMELANTTLHELEDYKRKSLEKQTKLSRELQNERNKLMELRHG